MAAEAPRLSVVIPVLNDAGALTRTLRELTELSAGSSAVELVVVDGGSSDGSAQAAAAAGARVVHSTPGRGRQLAAGVAAARGLWLWLLHADSRDLAAPLGWLCSLPAAAAAPRQGAWGRFDVRFETSSLMLSMVAGSMNLRSRLTGICTGDQGMFVHRDALREVGGVPDQPLMEDVELSRRLKRWGPSLARHETLTTSARRWTRHGVVTTILSMWWLRLRYFLGADAARLAREYYR